MAPGGYLWWYVDGISDCGEFGLTIIAFVGSVFSPYYAWSGRKYPEDHVSFNVCLYGRGARRWTMTERRSSSLSRDQDNFQVGPSSMRWTGDRLVIDFDEWSVPIPKRAKGRITVTPNAVNTKAFEIDTKGRHAWWPIAPSAHIKAEFHNPALTWTGDGYMDTNSGIEPLEDGFTTWDWSRAELSNGAALLYDSRTRDGEDRQIAVRFNKAADAEIFEPPPRVGLETCKIWRVARSTQSEGLATVTKTLEDTPFYARSILDTELFGERAISMHETLDCDRFASNWVRMLLPWRMPRIFWR